MIFLENRMLQAFAIGNLASPTHWTLSDRATRIAIASAPGTLFACTNYGQTVALANVSLLQAIIALPAFLLIFNLFAPTVLLGNRLLRRHNPKIKLPAAGLYAVAMAAVHLTIIAVLVTWLRASSGMAQALPMFWSEILVTCTPIWLAIYVCTLTIMNAGTRSDAAKDNWKLEVRHKGCSVFLGANEIHYALAEGNYVRLFTQHADYLVRMPLSALTRKLPSGRFTRSHRGAIVRNSLVRSIYGSNGVFRAQLHGGGEIPVSRSKLAGLKASIG